MTVYSFPKRLFIKNLYVTPQELWELTMDVGFIRALPDNPPKGMQGIFRLSSGKLRRVILNDK